MITSNYVLIHTVGFINFNVEPVDNMLSSSNWMITSQLSDDKTGFIHPAI
jgi:hypothetical protein